MLLPNADALDEPWPVLLGCRLGNGSGGVVIGGSGGVFVGGDVVCWGKHYPVVFQVKR